MGDIERRGSVDGDGGGEPQYEEVEEEEEKTPCWRKVVDFMLSYVGLTLICLAYCCLGGAIFQSLELPNEIDGCDEARAQYLVTLNSSLDLLWDIAKQNDLADEQKAEVLKIALDEFRVSFQNGSYDGLLSDLCANRNHNWGWANAMIWCITVITTIGYGHFSPQTGWGKLVCIAYAMIGIPIMLVLLANIGDFLANLFKYVYSTVCCCGCCVKDPAQVPENEWETEGKLEWRTDENGKPMGDAPTIIDNDDDEEEEDGDEWLDGAITVPLTVTIIVMAAWILIGTLIFGLTEQWEPPDAAYFSFVTVSTIGFGDMVPNLDNLGNFLVVIKLIVFGIYMLIGMALISMCFALMQDEVIAKLQWLGSKLGFVNVDDDEEEEEEFDPYADQKKKDQARFRKNLEKELKDQKEQADLNKSYKPSAIIAE